MTNQVIHTMSGFLKLGSILKTEWGWLAAIGLWVADYFAGHSFVVNYVLLVTVMDAVWGIVLSHRRGEFTLSELARQTVVKLGIYMTAIVAGIGLDRMSTTGIPTATVGCIIGLVEMWSSCASALIIYPNLPVLHFLKKALTGEIASKLGVGADEVEDILKQGAFPKKKGERHDG